MNRFIRESKWGADLKGSFQAGVYAACLLPFAGAVAARAMVSQPVKPGMELKYQAQAKTINIPGSEITGTRGGIHNSVTRIVLKPTHMIGGYAQYSYGFNYYGTIGTNRDEFVLVRKMRRVDWLDDETTARAAHA